MRGRIWVWGGGEGDLAILVYTLGAGLFETMCTRYVKNEGT